MSPAPIYTSRTKAFLSRPQAVRMTTFAVTAIFLRFATPLPTYLYQTIKVN